MRCKNCIHFENVDNSCNNKNFVEGEQNRKDFKDSSKISYAYNEGGCFHVGENFGCIHFEEIK